MISTSSAATFGVGAGIGGGDGAASAHSSASAGGVAAAARVDALRRAPPRAASLAAAGVSTTPPISSRTLVDVFRSLTPPAICAIMPPIPAAGAGAATRSDDSLAERSLTPPAICAIRSPLPAPPDAAGGLSSAFTLRSEPSFLKLRMPASSALLPSSAGGGVVDAAVGSGGGTGGAGGGAVALVQKAWSSGSCEIGVQFAVEPSTANA